MRSVFAADFEDWREAARRLLLAGVHPVELMWNPLNAQQGLFAEEPLPPSVGPQAGVSPAFIKLAQAVACHRNPERFTFMYLALWRLMHGEKHLLQLATDPLVHELQRMEKAVRRDAHKAKAFVRFRRVEEEGGEHYIAWHRPDHFILPLVSGFFARRFNSMEWTILTPDQSLHWDGETLAYGPGVDASHAPEADVLEDLWRDYYRATFNPARIKIKAMKREMPVRHWATLPEARIIQDLLDEAPERVERMLKHQEGLTRSAANYLPENRDVPSLEEAARGCQGCPLYAPATQTVFGVGPTDAPLMLVGEQPGDEEDKAGHPFIGPAGQVLNEAFAQAGVQRELLYLTNTVKHFKFTLVDKQRYHRTPNLMDVTACKPWLEAEIAAIRPKVILGLGVTAARALIGPGFTLKAERGQWNRRGEAQVAATYHPSAVLRAPEETRQDIFEALVEDLAQAKRRAA